MSALTQAEERQQVVAAEEGTQPLAVDICEGVKVSREIHETHWMRNLHRGIVVRQIASCAYPRSKNKP